MSAAPTAPGRLGERLDPPAVQSYLTQLDAWVRQRKAELDEIDRAALASAQRDTLTGDITLAMALWKAVSDRYQVLWRTWDGGRVGPKEQEQLSSLIWGRLDQTLDPSLLAASSAVSSGFAVSLPEACRLSDAVVQQLRVRLSLDPSAEESARRIATLRAAMERLLDQVGLEPPERRPAAQAKRERLVTRLDEVTEKAQRGGDVGGLLGPLEQDAATLERDLIVIGQQRRDARERAGHVGGTLASLRQRGELTERLAAQAVATVTPAPRYAVPDVTALGPVPDTPDALTAYENRLGRVQLAMNVAHDAYAAAIAQREELVQQLDGTVVLAQAMGLTTDPDVAASERLARDVLNRRPAPVAVARHLVAAHRAWVDTAKGKESA